MRSSAVSRQASVDPQQHQHRANAVAAAAAEALRTNHHASGSAAGPATNGYQWPSTYFPSSSYDQTMQTSSTDQHGSTTVTTNGGALPSYLSYPPTNGWTTGAEQALRPVIPTQASSTSSSSYMVVPGAPDSTPAGSHFGSPPPPPGSSDMFGGNSSWQHGHSLSSSSQYRAPRAHASAHRRHDSRSTDYTIPSYQSTPTLGSEILRNGHMSDGSSPATIAGTSNGSGTHDNGVGFNRPAANNSQLDDSMEDDDTSAELDSDNPVFSNLSAEDRTLLILRDENCLPWKDVSRRIKRRFGKCYRVPALQMRYKRLKDRIGSAPAVDTTYITDAYRWWWTNKWQLICTEARKASGSNTLTPRDCMKTMQELKRRKQANSMSGALDASDEGEPDDEEEDAAHHHHHHHHHHSHAQRHLADGSEWSAVVDRMS